MNATGTLGSTFLTVYNNCKTTRDTLTTQQKYYFVDSLCSNAVLMSDLNYFLYHLAKADTEMATSAPYTPNTTIVSTLNVAQTYLNNISADLALRYTNQSGTTIDGDFSTWYSNSTEFNIPTLQTDLCNMLAKYGSTATCP